MLIAPNELIAQKEVEKYENREKYIKYESLDKIVYIFLNPS